MIVAVLAAGCGRQERKGPAGAGPKAAVRLTYSVFFPPTHIQAKLAAEWAEAVRARTGGRVEVTVFPGGALTKPDPC
mgnify:CR=1 FL=1